MVAPGKPWKAEYAKSARAFCRTCQKRIGLEVLRFGKVTQSRRFDGLMSLWHHATCIMKKPKKSKKTRRIKPRFGIDDIEGLECLRWEDQQNIRNYVQDRYDSFNKASNPEISYGIEVSQAARAKCKCCNEKITKGEVRAYVKAEVSGSKANLAWHHALCFLKLYDCNLESLSGWENLSNSDQATLLSASKENGPTSPDIGTDQAISELNCSWGVTRKRKIAGSSDQHCKIMKTEPNLKATGSGSRGAPHDMGVKDGDSESKLEDQSRELWGMKDDLKKFSTISELKKMLQANDQSTKGSELDLRGRCAEGMIFGALKRCPICSGQLQYSGGTYRCNGFLSEWSKCSYSRAQPERIEGKWKIPEETKNQYLLKWFELQSSAKPVRVPPSSSEDNIGNLRVAISGLPKRCIEPFSREFELAGGQVHQKINKDTNCLVIKRGFLHISEIQKARRMKIPIVGVGYLTECVKQKKKLPFHPYEVEERWTRVGMTVEGQGTQSGVLLRPSLPGQSAMSVIQKGGDRLKSVCNWPNAGHPIVRQPVPSPVAQSAVHLYSGMQSFGHILENEGCFYNTTLSKTDLSTGVNSFYILQIIENHQINQWYVYRRWGRVGSNDIACDKLDRMSKANAIKEYKRLFKEKTGNPWEAWVKQNNFQKQPGKFLPLDIECGDEQNATFYERLQHATRRSVDDQNSQLAPAVKDLIKILFDAEVYRASMVQFQINLSEMPLGKLSKSNIQKGFETLTQIQNLLKDNDLQSPVRESLLVDASNRFFTVIPSMHPHVIRDDNDLRSKVKILEALQDMEIASTLAGFGNPDRNNSLDEMYKKLRCEIVPLSHDSDDYKLIEKYLLTTQAHEGWRLELEEAFSLEREGEFERFAPYREKLGNRMLLWHGSRLTNFVGILSQGLRIAPPEAPSSGYMFGKGIYFADLVSKSAQYCCCYKENSIGFMLLSEVALGNVYELTGAKYMDKAPKGSHSTKGLGVKVPNETRFFKWRDEIVVPCGKPVDSKVKASQLMHNEYIVYDTAQVKLQFLLKVRFRYK